MKAVAAKVLALLRSKKKSKHGNTLLKTPDGTFHSKMEYRRWQELKLLWAGGELFNLSRQVRIPLCYDGKLLGHYVADFVYSQMEDDTPWNPETKIFSPHAVVEDAKGYRTKEYNWKARHFEAQYGFKIREMKA